MRGNEPTGLHHDLRGRATNGLLEAYVTNTISYCSKHIILVMLARGAGFKTRWLSASDGDERVAFRVLTGPPTYCLFTLGVLLRISALIIAVQQLSTVSGYGGMAMRSRKS